MMPKEKATETILTLVLALIIFGLILKIKLLFLLAVGLGVIGLFIKPLAQFIHIAWMKLAEAMGAVSSKVLISLIFYLFISPIAFMFRFFNKNTLQLKNNQASTFSERNHLFVKTDFERIW